MTNRTTLEGGTPKTKGVAAETNSCEVSPAKGKELRVLFSFADQGTVGFVQQVQNEFFSDLTRELSSPPHNYTKYNLPKIIMLKSHEGGWPIETRISGSVERQMRKLANESFLCLIMMTPGYNTSQNCRLEASHFLTDAGGDVAGKFVVIINVSLWAESYDEVRGLVHPMYYKIPKEENKEVRQQVISIDNIADQENRIWFPFHPRNLVDLWTGNSPNDKNKLLALVKKEIFRAARERVEFEQDQIQQSTLGRNPIPRPSLMTVESAIPGRLATADAATAPLEREPTKYSELQTASSAESALHSTRTWARIEGRSDTSIPIYATEAGAIVSDALGLNFPKAGASADVSFALAADGTLAGAIVGRHLRVAAVVPWNGNLYHWKQPMVIPDGITGPRLLCIAPRGDFDVWLALIDGSGELRLGTAKDATKDVLKMRKLVSAEPETRAIFLNDGLLYTKDKKVHYVGFDGSKRASPPWGVGGYSALALDVAVAGGRTYVGLLTASGPRQLVVLYDEGRRPSRADVEASATQISIVRAPYGFPGRFAVYVTGMTEKKITGDEMLPAIPALAGTQMSR